MFVSITAKASTLFRSILTVVAILVLNTTAVSIAFKDEASKPTFFEDFYANENVSQVCDADSKQLELPFTILNNTDSNSTEEFYKRVVKNLKEKCPELEKLRLRGGYLYKPDNNQSTEELEQELQYIIQTLKTIDQAVNGVDIRLRRLILTARLGFESQLNVNVTEVLENAFPDTIGKLNNDSPDHWSVPFAIQHGRGLLKLSILTDQSIKTDDRSRFNPIVNLPFRTGPGPMIGSASYDPKRNVTIIWTAKTGYVKLDGDHMDSEELENYFPRNLNNE